MVLRSLTDELLRRRARVEETPLDTVRVRIARSADEYNDAFQLVHCAYVTLGIESVRAPTQRVIAQHHLPEATVLNAYEGERIVGTMTVALDSPVGLPLDKDYRQQLDALRTQGAVMAEYCALAVVSPARHTGVTTLLNIAAYRWARHVLGATHTVIGVHPKAAPFYRAVYDFHPFGGAQPHATLQAPVIGLAQDMRSWPRFCRRHFRRPMRSGRLPVEHFEGEPLPCLDLPDVARIEDLARWKMPRAVFRQLFGDGSDLLTKLDPSTLRHLCTARSRDTLQLPTMASASPRPTS